MRLLIILTWLGLWIPTLLSAATPPTGRVPATGATSAETGARTTEHGLFTIETAIPGDNLAVGANTADILVRDKAGRPVEGARLGVVTWLPGMGTGVWEKPRVTEKGGGSYHVDNISVTSSGRWELKITVKSGAREDRIVFAYTVPPREKSPPARPAKTKGSYSRTLHRYTIPNVTLLNQDGRRVNLKALTESGKPVIVNFIYTTCTTICPVLSASFTNLRKGLGPDLDKYQFISISIDPEHDRPEQMKRYLSRFTTQKGWDFLTGSREDITRVLKVFDAYVTDKMAHEPIYLLHGPRSDEWVRIKGLTWSADLMGELKGVAQR